MPIQDIAFMQAALALARRGLGRTAPNPAVAALVVSPDGVMLGRAVTAPGGRPHAEALALVQAGKKARGSTLYVTLEPCARRSASSYGSSCTDEILNHRVARVVIGAADPSAFAGGAGAARLREAGLEVVEHVLSDAASWLNLGHMLRITAHRPMVSVKLAATADGFAGTADGKPLIITGEESRALVHRMRAQADALITGIGTILADDPRLDVRLPGMASFSPMVVVADTSGRIPKRAQVFQPGRSMLIATAAPEAVSSLLAQHEGAGVLPIPRAESGHLDLSALLAALAARGITRVMVEAGPQLAEAFAAHHLMDELVLLTGATPTGTGLPALGAHLAAFIARARSERLHEERMLGMDRLDRYWRKQEIG
jgi:diaminohydroxyphosphoribosylaminopyrimidine deaminase / 5-amino-6-(5-phosphoribosylamino)uracil reductase